MVDERELVLRVVQGLPGAEGAFIQAYRGRLLRASEGFLGGLNAESEDMVQDTFLVGLPRLKKIDLSAPVFPWLRQICLRLCYERRRSRDGVLACLEDELRDYMRMTDVEQVRSTRAEVRLQQKRELLRDLIKQLPPDGRQIIQLRNVHGMTYAQMGEVLDLSLADIVGRWSDARAQMRAFVDGLSGL